MGARETISKPTFEQKELLEDTIIAFREIRIEKRSWYQGSRKYCVKSNKLNVWNTNKNESN